MLKTVLTEEQILNRIMLALVHIEC